jgi:hypothetical protein
MQEFSNFENFQFVKNTKFSKFSQNLSFYYRVLRTKKKLLQFTQRITKENLAGIGEPMVPDRDMAGCFRKYLPQYKYKLLTHQIFWSKIDRKLSFNSHNSSHQNSSSGKFWNCLTVLNIKNYDQNTFRTAFSKGDQPIFFCEFGMYSVENIVEVHIPWNEESLISAGF